MSNIGVKSMGIKCPLIKEGDDIIQITVDSVLEACKVYVKNKMDTYGHDDFYYTYSLQDNDIIGVTESVLARAQGNYADMRDIALSIKKLYGQSPELIIFTSIYSRNRFAMILKGIARACSKINLIMPEVDSVGNPLHNHPFTGLDYDVYYKEICEKEGCTVEINPPSLGNCKNILICELHYGNYASQSFIYEFRKNNGEEAANELKVFTLADICNDKCEYGVLGSNKATDEKIKLFPQDAFSFCEEVKKRIKEKTDANVLVCVYGDGCFKDPVGGIWEFADPVSLVGYTDPEMFDSTPNEIKLKYCIDNPDKFNNGEKTLEDNIKKTINTYNILKPGESDANRQGTTPRRRGDLIASLMDLTSGSGDKGTPIVLVQNYFKKYTDD